jgi:SAM-dependent methyltransferase
MALPTEARGYALPNAWELARRRLELLEASHDQSSIRRAEVLGVGEGWRCLDAGAGGGSFARWLAGRVGKSGSVVAADLDTRLLEEVDTPGLEVRRIDLTTDDVPRDEFDLVHTRLVLIHVPERDQVLQRLAAAVRPGGLLMLEEDAIYPVLATAEGAYREAWLAFLGMMESAGVDAEWPSKLPERLEAQGLVEVDAEVDTQLFRGGSDPAQFWSLTWLQARDRVASTGVPAEVIDEGRAVLEDPGRWFYGPAKVIAWGRRPEG